MNKKAAALLLIALIAIGIVIFCLYPTYQPRSIFDYDATESDTNVIARINNEGNMTLITDYDKSELLEYLQTCKEIRTRSKAGGYKSEDVEIDLLIHGNGYIKHVLLGKINYSYCNIGEPKYEILDSDIVIEKIKDIVRS